MRDLGDWKGYFTATILSRGEEYYQRGEVCHIYKREDGYEARVQGCELYNVRIMTDEEGKFLSASCDCPYCLSGKNCKHEAALLFALENGEPVLGMLNNTVYEKQDVSELCNIVVDMDGDWVKSILASLVADNTVAADFLYSKVIGSHPELLYKYVLNAIRMIVEDSMSFYETDMIIRVFHSHLDSFIKQKKQSVEINRIIFDSLQVIRRNRNYNPYNFKSVADDILSMLSLIWDEADADTKNEISKLYNSLLASSLYDEIIDSFMIDNVSDTEYMRKRVSLMERGYGFRAVTLMKNMDKLDFDYGTKLKEMMKFKGQAEHHVWALCKQYEEEGRWEEYAVLGILVFYAETVGKKLMEHGQKELSIPLFKIALTQGSSKAENAFMYLDAIADEMRVDEAREIISLEGYDCYAADILAYVKDWDMLLSFFDANPLNDKLIQYEDSLYGFSPERLIEVYRKRCLLLLPTKGLHKQRPSYRCFADNLKKLSSIGGRNEAIEIATYVKEKYPERTTLFAILSEYGF